MEFPFQMSFQFYGWDQGNMDGQKAASRYDRDDGALDWGDGGGNGPEKNSSSMYDIELMGHGSRFGCSM